MTEVRKSNRKRAVLSGKIIFNDRKSTIDCLIRNVSDDGAKIEVSEAVVFPARFELQVPQHGRAYQARMAWRQGNEAGLEFANEVVGGREVRLGDAMTARLRELESENAVLRKRVIDLKNQLDRYFQSA
ncbi:MAG: hypothetical protein FJX29_00115 [Alphaproteobacteria bacterium]|nr:hypothetical protein [Alphaproteobacteria bacterium]